MEYPMTKKSLTLWFLLFLPVINIFAQDKNASKPINDAKQIPVSYGILADNSGSFRTLLEMVIDTVKGLVEENKPDDETFLVRFVDSDKIKLAQEFTDSKSDLQDAAEDMFIEGGATAITDAVDFSAKYLTEKAKSEPNRHKALILICDGDDRRSLAKLETVLMFLKNEKIRVYAIGVSDEKFSTKILDKLAKETGGKVYTPKNPAEIKTAVKELAVAMRAE
ncbi:MAG: vWA domain-containing protein [Pyrinomonadaceae bacterium]